MSSDIPTPSNLSSQRRRRAAVTSRKKACAQCTTAKAKCDLRRPLCTRCKNRQLACKYEYAASVDLSEGAAFRIPVTRRNPAGLLSPGMSSTSSTQPNLPPYLQNADLLMGDDGTDAACGDRYVAASVFIPLAIPSNDPVRVENTQNLSFLDISLVSAIDFSRVRDRWLDAFITKPFQQTPKNFSPRTIQYIQRVLKSYPKILLQGSGNLPPFIHPLQLEGGEDTVAMSNCLSLVRMWWHRAPGSSKLVTETVKREMERLMNEHTTCDQTSLLGAFQAYLIYCLTLFSESPPSEAQHESTSPFQGTLISSLQELGSHSTKLGVICPEELSIKRPKWEAWIVAESKRRTLYTMYLLENTFNWRNGTVSYVAEELALLPAPCGKRLWEARSREVWEQAYDDYLQGWKKGGLRMHEFWPHGDPDEERVRRVDSYAEDVDEFGMMLLAVCTLTYGS